MFFRRTYVAKYIYKFANLDSNKKRLEGLGGGRRASPRKRKNNSSAPGCCCGLNIVGTQGLLIYLYVFYMDIYTHICSYTQTLKEYIIHKFPTVSI